MPGMQNEPRLAFLDQMLRKGGTREIHGKQHNQEILTWFAIAGASWIGNDEEAWCSACACACAHFAGLHHPKSVRARKWLDLPASAATPIALKDLLPGDIIVFKRGTSKTAGHVAALLYRDGNMLYVVGGNQGDMVQPRKYSVSDFLGGMRLKANQLVSPLGNACFDV